MASINMTKVTQGQPLKIPAGNYNAWNIAANNVQNVHGLTAGSGGPNWSPLHPFQITFTKKDEIKIHAGKVWTNVANQYIQVTEKIEELGSGINYIYAKLSWDYVQQGPADQWNMTAVDIVITTTEETDNFDFDLIYEDPPISSQETYIEIAQIDASGTYPKLTQKIFSDIVAASSGIVRARCSSFYADEGNFTGSMGWDATIDITLMDDEDDDWDDTGPNCQYKTKLNLTHPQMPDSGLPSGTYNGDMLYWVEADSEQDGGWAIVSAEFAEEGFVLAMGPNGVPQWEATGDCDDEESEA